MGGVTDDPITSDEELAVLRVVWSKPKQVIDRAALVKVAPLPDLRARRAIRLLVQAGWLRERDYPSESQVRDRAARLTVVDVHLTPAGRRRVEGVGKPGPRARNTRATAPT